MSTFSYLIKEMLRRCGLAPAVAAFAVLAVLVSGCSEPVTIYQVPGDYMAGGKKVLVLPFMDTRTFVDDKDPHKEDMGRHARAIFVAAMREKAAGVDVEIMTPEMARPRKSLTNAEVAELGRQYGADAVIAGQVFSFTDTRAASIPPRAGMFVRVISASDGSLLFVGDHYQAASIPGASGGRELQAKNVAVRLVEGFLSQAGTMISSAGRIASASALAVIAPPLPVKIQTANKSGRAKTAGGKGNADDGSIPGLIGNNINNSKEWDEQIVPEVPPLLDFEQNFYEAPVPPLPGGTAQPSSASPENPGAEASAAEESPADTGEDDEPDDGEADSEEPDGEEPDSGEADSEEPDSGEADSEEPPEADTIIVMQDEDVEAEALPDMDDLSAIADMAEPEPESVPGTVAETATASESMMAAAPEESFPYEYSGTAARAIDELPELDFGSVDTALSDSEMRAVIEAAEMSGDELAADLFDSEDDMMQNAAAGRRRRPVRAGAPETAVPTTTLVPQAASADVVAEASAPIPVQANADHYGPFELDPDTLEVRTPVPASTSISTAAAKPVTSPRQAAALQVPEEGGWDSEGLIISTPIAIEQPRTIRADDIELEDDPELALPEADALVAAPSRASRPGAVRLLVLPYHDRVNPNNLINHTGGGEVVTTLYATQFASDPGLQIMWDASGQATHNLLLTRDEAIRMGRLAGADYVIRGQVVEFRRAQSVPSFYSAVISTAVLAAQIFFAEMSGVDVATEVYRVSDGVCVMSRRDRAQQKYVVQAEKTVRRMAGSMAASVVDAIRDPNPEAMDPLIDELEPVTIADRFK